MLLFEVYAVEVVQGAFLTQQKARLLGTVQAKCEADAIAAFDGAAYATLVW